MKVLLLSTSDIEGGAARAAYRLHQGLQAVGTHSRMLVQSKASGDPTVIAPKNNLSANLARSKVTFDALPLKLYPQVNHPLFSPQWIPDRIPSQVRQFEPDVINLHWANAGYLQIETVAKLKRPVVWTLHDMWAFTGGCHYSFDCDRYQLACGSCPQLQSRRDRDLSQWIWRRKSKSWQHINHVAVAPSVWLAKLARSSSLFRDVRVEVIPNGLNLKTFRPIQRQTARDLLNLPQDKQLILFGATFATGDKRKGFHLLQPALQHLSQSNWQGQAELVVFGASRPPNAPDFGMPTHYMGALNDDLSLAMLYSAADVFVLPATQDNLPNTVLEAIACGTPCVAFAIGGMPDMIEHQRNGFLAQPYQIEELAQGIAWVLDNPSRHLNLCQRAREKAEQEFALELQARRYTSLFAELESNDAHLRLK